MVNSMDLVEKTLRREDKYHGKIMDVHVDEVLLPNGERRILCAGTYEL